MAERQSGNRFINHAAADQIIVPVAPACSKNRWILCSNPAKAYTGKGEYFGHGADGNAFFIKIRSRRRPNIFLCEVAVNFIDHQVSAAFPGDFHDFLKKGFIHQCTGRVVRVIETDHLGSLDGKTSEFIKVRQVVLIFFQMHDFDICAKRCRNGIQLLVGRHDGNDAVARFHD